MRVASRWSGRDVYGGTTTIIQASLDQSQEYRGEQQERQNAETHKVLQ